MELVFNILSLIFIVIGSIAILIGSFGLIRLPDIFSRIHAVGMIDTAGVGFLVLGMIFYAGWSMVSIKLLIMAIILFFTSPISGHAVANAAKQFGIKTDSKNIDNK